jgi:putative SOS response-associated peptidase YedK
LDGTDVQRVRTAREVGGILQDDAGLELGIPTQQSELDLPESDDVRINDMAPVMRAAGNNIELVSMNFSFPPSGPKGGPVFNFRSEGRSFANSNRCLIPASGFFEFTGKKYPKKKHRFTLNGQPFLAIAGIWREGQGNTLRHSKC